MTLRGILSVLQVCAALAYLGLAVRLYRSGRVASLPCFTLYVGLMVVDLIWHPVRLPQAVLIEPWLMGLRFCSVIEAAGLISEDLAHRKPLIVSVLFLGCSISSQTLGYFDLSTWRGIYTTIYQHAFVGLAGVCVLLNAYQVLYRKLNWDVIWLPHFRILSAYMVGRAGLNFLHIPGSGAAGHHVVRIAILAFVCGWATVWLWYDRRELRTPRLEHFNARL